MTRDVLWSIFTRPDPVAQYGDGMSLYAYVRSSPVSYRDPQGLKVYVVTRRAHLATIGGKLAQLDALITGVELRLELPDLGEEANQRLALKRLRWLRWYLANSRHCILVVTDCAEKIYGTEPVYEEVDMSYLPYIDMSLTPRFRKTGRTRKVFMGIDIGNGTAWDYNKWRADTTPELEGRGGKTAKAFSPSEITQITGNNDKDALVTKIANAMVKKHRKAKDYAEVRTDTKARYNCCDWVIDVLNQAGLKFENPNVDPFSDRPAPAHLDPEWMRKWVIEKQGL